MLSLTLPTPALPLLLLSLFFFIPFADSSKPSIFYSNSSIPNDINSPFVRPLPLLRQGSPNCPCTCSTANPKTSNPCAQAPRGCMVVRCEPRTDGFSCCDSIPGLAEEPEDVIPDLEFIVDNAEDAVRQNPRRSEAAVDVLDRCAFDLGALVGERSGSPARFSSRTAHLYISARQSTLEGRLRQRFIEATQRVLRFIRTELQIHFPL